MDLVELNDGKLEIVDEVCFDFDKETGRSIPVYKVGRVVDPRNRRITIECSSCGLNKGLV